MDNTRKQDEKEKNILPVNDGGKLQKIAGSISSFFDQIRLACSAFFMAITGTETTAEFHFDLLSWREIVSWFSNWINGHQNVNEDTIGFTINETMKDRPYVLVQGIFNKTANTVEEARRITADKLDQETRQQCFGAKKVTLFT